MKRLGQEKPTNENERSSIGHFVPIGTWNITAYHLKLQTCGKCGKY